MALGGKYAARKKFSQSEIKLSQSEKELSQSDLRAWHSVFGHSLLPSDDGDSVPYRQDRRKEILSPNTELIEPIAPVASQQELKAL